MRINKIEQNFTANTNEPKKHDFLNQFHERAKNSADMTDTVVVPRTIFKGYLGFMAGTALLTLGNVFNKYAKFSKTLNFAGALTSLYGTYSFVRPYIIKDCKGVETTKQ